MTGIQYLNGVWTKALTALAILFIMTAGTTSWAQTWTITKVVDNTTPCSATAFFNPSTSAFAAIDGPWVVFVDAGNDDCTSNDGESLWSYNLTTGSFVKLADTTTLVPPSNTYQFESFEDTGLGNSNNLQVQDGTVLFYGYDAGMNTTTNCSGGLYTVPVGGGAVTRTVDYSMSLPGYGGSFCGLFNSDGLDGELGMSLDHGTVVFSAQADPGANDGIWSAPAGVDTKESQLKRIVDEGTVWTSKYPPGCTDNCDSIGEWPGAAFIQGSTTVFSGDGGFSGVSAVFIGSIKDPILQSVQALPGDDSHNSETYPYSYAIYDGPIVDGGDIYFYGYDPDYLGSCAGGVGHGTFAGLFEMSTKGTGVTSILNTCDTQPNGDTIGANSFITFAANEGTTVFSVEDSTMSSSNVLDSSYNGVVEKLIQPEDPLPTGASCNGEVHAAGCATSIGSVGTGGMNGGRAVFYAEGGPYWYDNGIYVASLACASSDTSGTSVTLGALTYNSKTGIWKQTAKVKNTGSSTLTGPLSLVLANLSSDATLTDGNGSTVCFAPVGSPYIDLKLTDNELKKNASVTATLEFSAPSTATIKFTNEVAGAGAR